jgi:carboxymethylenebutenolidase
MKLRLIISCAITAALLSTPAFAQNLGKVKDLVNKDVKDAQEERNRQLNEAMGNTQQKPPQQQQQPVQQPKQNGTNAEATMPIKSGWITRKAKDGKTEVRLYFAYPEKLDKKAPAAGLVVIQEWWGVNDDIQERVREFAQHGYYAVAPDLYRGKATADPKEAQKLHDAMKNDEAMIDMKTAVDLLEEESTNGVVDPKRVASIGWCMGGQQSLLLSLADPRIQATVIFYGPLVTDSKELMKLQGPVLGIFGATDKAPSPADVEKFRKGLKDAGKTDVTILTYDGVGHAFASKAAAKMGMYNDAKAKEAWAKTWSWLNEKLAKK